MWILLVILAVPIIEIALFVQVGPVLGVFGTLAEVLASAALGVILMRREPQRNAAELRATLEQEQSPASPLAHSALRLFGAILIVLPGFFTDFMGLLLLVPPVRHILLVQLLTRLRDRHAQGDVTIIEGEYHRDPERPAPPEDRVEGPHKRD
ncbi:MAG: FxsA family protein [Rhodobacteraceae bacterium]|nr:MAG: FxsA family protein [Paracoccaceae bacterium]